MCTSDRVIVLFDEQGEKRDKFSLKPADAKVNVPFLKSIEINQFNFAHFLQGTFHYLYNKVEYFHIEWTL